MSSLHLNGDREGSPHQQPNENRDTNFSRKEKKEILVGNDFKSIFILFFF